MTDLAGRVLRKAENLFWELRLGISTRGYFAASAPQNASYGTTSFNVVFAILDALSLTEDDVLVDLGCGMGRVVCCAALRGLRGVIGVEYESALAEIARQNADRLCGRHAPLTIVHGGAEDFDYSRGTIFYLYNPFGAEILGQVMTRLEKSLAHRSGPFRIVYMKPVSSRQVSRPPKGARPK
jgi:predicted RNA methylase